MDYTYDEFLKQAEASGLADQFSAYDLHTARAHPEFGMTMLSYKKDYNAAETEEERTAINSQAEELRRRYGSYTGGRDGSGYYSTGPTPATYKESDAVGDILDRLEGYGEFSYESAPTYTSSYGDEIRALLDQVQHYGDFTWDRDSDPVYSAYAKQYLRQGERARQNALAQAASLTGGQVSSAAMAAAGQAEDYYASQLADAVPELYRAAYNRYMDEYGLLTDRLAQARQAEQLDYDRYQDQLKQYNTDRDLSYDRWLQGYDMLSDNLSGRLAVDEENYDRHLDQVEHNADRQELARRQVDAILASGSMPDARLISQSGYDSSYISALGLQWVNDRLEADLSDSEKRAVVEKAVDDGLITPQQGRQLLAGLGT